ncbi:MAG: hypothetical protein IPG58_15705 [Acidobacteria bacterium]|nr:hypothetical protein [Acidobacteriota bacterium]
MKRPTISSFILMLISVMIIAESANAQTKRIRFRKGTSSATVSGFIQCDSSRAIDYVLGGKEGQRLTASVYGMVGNASLRIVDRNDNETSGSETLDYVYPYSGDVKIWIFYFPCGNQIKYRPKGKNNYKLRVSIN